MAVHLFVRSAYSLLQSNLMPKRIGSLAKSRGYSAIALTDNSVMTGTLDFYYACLKENVKPILGVEVFVKENELIGGFVMLAKNYNGYKNCLKASSLVNCEKETYLSLDQLSALSSDCIIIAEGEGGLFESNLIHEDKEDVLKLLSYVQTKIPHFYLGLSYNEMPFWQIKNRFFKSCGELLGLKSVALPKVFYADKKDEEVLKVLKGIRMSMTVQDPNLVSDRQRDLCDLSVFRKYYDEADVKMTDIIASECNCQIQSDKTELPKFSTPDNVTSAQYLTQLCVAGCKKRGCTSKEYLERLKYELDVIISMKFEDYFLIVWDFIRYSRKNDIFVGLGRGSAAGSLVSYCLGITHIDPLKYDLLFERFLNPERISMPDIDTDFPDNRRDEVIQYVKEKYGENHVAHICTFGTLAAKQALRDAGRVLAVPLKDVDILCKLVPDQLKITLKEAYEQSASFKKYINANQKFIDLFDMACRIEGLPRHISTHAAGIVLSSKPLDEVVPCIRIEDDMVSTQYTMEYLESLGLIKMDFLGLRNLTIIDEVVKQINLTESFDIMRIPLDDQKTYQLIQRVDTLGVFQLESDGMKNLLRKMQVSCFDDIVATIALFRPGPMENIPLYLENRANADHVEYLHPDLIPILKSTYGIIIYQEQIMLISQKMANFTLAKADTLRKAMSKKKLDQLEALESDFIQGCINNNYSEEIAHKVYDLILKFANYGFNKSHSVAYGMVAYQMAYLKANYPLQFYCAILNGVIGSSTKTFEYVEQCKKNGIRVLPPNVNMSSDQFVIFDNSIIMPFTSIKGLGNAVSNQILNERNEHGIFTDFYDFVARILTRKVNRKTIESLIDAGALDGFKLNRKSMYLSLDEAISYGDLVRIEVGGQSRIDLGLVSKPVPVIANEQILERCEKERAVLGFYLTVHPISQIKQKLYISSPTILSIKQKAGPCKGFMLINRVKQHRTKNGDMMAFVNGADESDSIDLVIMPRLYAQTQNFLVKGNFIIFEGKMEIEKGSVLTNNVKKCEI